MWAMYGLPVLSFFQNIVCPYSKYICSALCALEDLSGAGTMFGNEKREKQTFTKIGDSQRIPAPYVIIGLAPRDLSRSVLAMRSHV